MPAYQAYPDVEAVCVQALQDAGLTASSSLPKKPNYPVVTVQRTGGLPAANAMQLLDGPVIDFTVWGNNKGEARDVADEARVAIYDLIDTTNEEWECSISQVEQTLPTIYLPDPETNRDRYVFALRVWAFSKPATS